MIRTLCHRPSSHFTEGFCLVVPRIVNIVKKKCQKGSENEVVKIEEKKLYHLLYYALLRGRFLTIFTITPTTVRNTTKRVYKDFDFTPALRNNTTEKKTKILAKPEFEQNSDNHLK